MSKRVLLTGANGFIAQHILAQFLDAGHSVRAIVRSQAKIDQLKHSFPSFIDKQLDFGIVPDITAAGAFDSVLSSTPPFDTVLHTASPFNYRQAESNADFLEPAVKGTTEILNGITRVAPGVRRVVLTSSMAAVIDFTADKVTTPAKVYSESDWNPATWEQALETTNMNAVYQASKKFAEKAAWDFVSEKKPAFDLVTINPPMVYGPLYDVSIFKSVTDLNQSTWNLYKNFMDTTLTSDSPLPPQGLHLYADVRDAARAHLLAAITPEAGGKRFILVAGAASNQRIANIFREALGRLRDRIPKGESENEAMPEGTFEADTTLVRTVLGLKFLKDEDTFGQLGEQIADIDELSEKST